jgi:hypothetical protein
LIDVDCGDDVVYGALAAAQRLDDAAASRISEGLKDVGMHAGTYA